MDIVDELKDYTNHAKKAKRIKEGYLDQQSFFSFYEELCRDAYEKVTSDIKYNNNAYIGFAAMYQIKFLSLNDFSGFFPHYDFIVDWFKTNLLVCCCLFNGLNWMLFQSTSAEPPDISWYGTKRRILKDFIWNTCAQSPSISKCDMQYFYECATKMRNYNLQRLIMQKIDPTKAHLIKRGMCMICSNEDAGIQFNPCGDCCCCLGCAENIKKCPLCHLAVDEVISINNTDEIV